MRYLLFIGVLLLVSCKDKAETDSFLIMEQLQRRGLIFYYANDQREQLRQEIETILRD